MLTLLLLVGAAAHFTLVWPERGEPRALLRWGAQIAVMTGFFAASAANLVLLAASFPEAGLDRVGAAFARCLSRPGGDTERSADRVVPRVLALFVLLVAATLNVAALDRVPHVPDGVAYLFQARGFADGRLSYPAPPVPEAFEVYLLDVRDGVWRGTTNPGWPVLLAVGVVFGVPWLVNPLLAALVILATHALTRRLADRGTAHGVALLLATSPWFLFLAASFMTHVATLLGALLGGLGVLASLGGKRPRSAALGGGLAFGWVFLIRPLDGLLVGAFAGVLLLVAWRRRRVALGAVLAFGLGCALTGSLLFAFNAAQTGSALHGPMDAYLDAHWYPGANRLGFGADVGNPPGTWGPLDPIRGHGWRDVVLNTDQNLYNLSFELWGWPLGALALAILHALWGRRTRLDRLMIGLLVLLALGYNLYWFSGGPDYGARYWFLMIYPLAWLTVRGGRTLVERLQATDDHAGPRVALGASVVLLGALTVFLPWRAVAKYPGYRGFHGDFRRAAEVRHLGHDLVIVESDSNGDYGSAFLLNRPDFPEGHPIFVRDLGSEVERRLGEAFPGRRVVRLVGRAPRSR